MFPSSRLSLNCSDAAMNMIIDGRRGTVSAAGPQVIWEELDLVWWRKCFLVCLPDRELGGQLQYGGQDHLNWDQDQVKTNTRQRRDENFEGLRPSKDEEQYKLQAIFQLIWNIHLPRENTCRRQIKQHTFSLFQLPTHNFPLWGRDKTDQDRVKMQSSPRRDGDGLLTTTNTNQYLWQVPPQLPVCKKQLLQSIVQKYCFIQLNVHIQQWKYTLLTATANYALLNKRIAWRQIKWSFLCFLLGSRPIETLDCSNGRKYKKFCIKGQR